MRKITFILIALSYCINSHVWAQGVAINTTGADPDNSSMLDVVSTTKGVLIPRMLKTDRDDISSPVTGLMIFQTDNTAGYYYYDGSSWELIGSGAFSINDLSDGKTDDYSVFLGSGAGANDDGTVNNNVGLGISALNNNSTGTQNVAIGYEALKTNSSGNSNTSIGHRSLITNSTGNSNTAIGTVSLYFNSTGNENISIGVSSMYKNTTGSYNTCIGRLAMESNTIGDNNVAIGYEANRKNQEGSNNTIIGYEAGMGTSIHDKSGNVFLGYQAGCSEHGSNKLYIENSNSLTPLIYGEFDTELLRVNGTLDINNAYQFPTTDGSSGQVLQSDGSGILSWATASGDFLNGGEAGGADRTLGNTDNFALGFLTNNTSRLHITNDGRVGIGTTIPGEKVHIKGSGIVRSIIETTTDNSSGSAAYRMVRPSSAAWAAFDFSHGASTDNQWGFGLRAGSTGLSFWDATQGDVIRFYLEQTTGKVGIGNTSPTAKLDVNGTTGYDQLRMRTSFTPSSTSDANGNIGDIAWDDSYMYIKTSAGWKRATLGTW